MPNPDVVDRFVAQVASGDYVGAIEAFYREDASMQENRAPPRVGRAALVENEKGVMSAFKEIRCEILGRPLINGDRVAIHWRFAFSNPGMPARTLEEVAWQRWDGDRIAEETFFYDPAQMAG